MMVLCFFSCKKAPPPAAPAPPEETVDPSVCELDEKASDVWNEHVRDSLDLSVKIIDGVIEAWEAENLTRQLDEFTSDWVKNSESACREHYFEKATTSEAYKEKAACFDAALSSCRDIIEMMRSGDHGAIERSSSLKESLGGCL